MSKVTSSFHCKAILLGDSGVGKTQMMLAVRNYEEDEVLKKEAELPRHEATVGVDFAVVTRIVSSETVARILLWDTAGQERFATIMPSYIRETEIIFLVYDITSQSSFDSLKTRWLQLVDTHRNVCGREHIVVFLVGNKSDLKEMRAVSEVAAVEFALKHTMIYVETTCLVRKVIHDLMSEAAVRIFERYARNGTVQQHLRPAKAYTGASTRTTVLIDNRRASVRTVGCCQK